jgi:hypothetical protein
MKQPFSTEMLVRNEVTPRMARAASNTPAFVRNFGTRPHLPPAGQAIAKRTPTARGKF